MEESALGERRSFMRGPLLLKSSNGAHCHERSAYLTTRILVSFLRWKSRLLGRGKGAASCVAFYY
eukprot:6179259-Pleurochrysis_carterae.AAC.3